MAKLKELLGDAYAQMSQELQDKFKDVDLVDSSQYVAKDKFTALSDQLKTANTTITDLKKNNTDNETLQTKVGEYETKVKEYEKQIKDMQFNHSIEGALKVANVKNAKAVKALLNLDNVKIDGETLIGLNDQLEALKKSDGYLFSDEQQKPPFAGITPKDGVPPKAGYNPWKKETFNLTDQGKIFKENPEQAKQLMAQCEVN